MEKTLRDEIAIAALQGYLARHADINGRSETINSAAYIAYKLADAMLAQRGEG